MPNPIQKKHPLPKSLMRDLPFLPKWGLRGRKASPFRAGRRSVIVFQEFRGINY